MKKKRAFMDGYKTYNDSEGRGNPREWRETFSERFTQEEAESILHGQPDTPHAILGVPLGASIDQIKKAFRDLIQKWHPDKHPDNMKEAATIMSRRIIAAYSILNPK